MDITWTAVAANTVGFVLGIMTWLPFTIWSRRETDDKEQDMARGLRGNTGRTGITGLDGDKGKVGKTGDRGSKGARGVQGPRGRGPTPGALVLIILMAAVMLIGFGVQQSAYQSNARERDECYQTWGEDMVRVLDTRVNSNTRLGNKEEARDNAVDNIILLFVALRAIFPPPGEPEVDQRFGEVLARFVTAKDKLEDARDRNTNTRRTNPYPVLNCSGDKDEDE